MRVFILKILDIVALVLVVLTTIVGLLAGLAAAAEPYAPVFVRTFAPILGGVGGLLSGVLISGGILALTDIAANTRRTAELLEIMVRK